MVLALLGKSDCNFSSFFFCGGGVKHAWQNKGLALIFRFQNYGNYEFKKYAYCQIKEEILKCSYDSSHTCNRDQCGHFVCFIQVSDFIVLFFTFLLVTSRVTSMLKKFYCEPTNFQLLAKCSTQSLTNHQNFF